MTFECTSKEDRLKVLLWNAIDYMRDDFVSKSCIEIDEMIADYLGSTVEELEELGMIV